MRFAIISTLAAAVVSTSASLVVRQSSPPQCYLTCAAQANYGNCSSSDAGCLCRDPTFVSGTTQCIEQTCQGANLTASLAMGQQLCLAVGVTLSSAASSTASSIGTSAGTTPTSSASSSASAAATTSQAAAAAVHGPNTFIGLAAVGLAFALAL